MTGVGVYHEDVPGAVAGALRRERQVHSEENAKFFAGPLPRRGGSLGLSGGAGKLGVVSAGTAFAAALSPRE